MIALFSSWELYRCSPGPLDSEEYRFNPLLSFSLAHYHLFAYRNDRALPTDCELERNPRGSARKTSSFPLFRCLRAGNAAVLADCFDPDIVLYTPHGEFRGRAQVMEYLSQRHLKYAPNLCYKMTPNDVKTYGDALWYS